MYFFTRYVSLGFYFWRFYSVLAFVLLHLFLDCVMFVPSISSNVSVGKKRYEDSFSNSLCCMHDRSLLEEPISTEQNKSLNLWFSLYRYICITLMVDWKFLVFLHFSQGSTMVGYTCVCEDGKPFDPKYLCSSCTCVLRDPVQTKCGHRYCRACVDELLTR